MIIYTVNVICDRCGRFKQEHFVIPIPLLRMRDETRKQAHSAGWLTVMESGDRRDYCSQCVDGMKLRRK